jgi:sugar/nucleoside kinase (ribokinase family)
MMLRNGIICGGSLCIDVNKVIDRLPPPEHVATIVSETPDSGGPGFNMAVNLARLGADFPLDLVAAVGDDDHGRLAQEICARHGIGTSGLAVLPGQRTSYTDVMI